MTTEGRRDLAIASYGETLHAWFYPAAKTEIDNATPPVIVMAHGLGAIKTMRLDAFASRFSQAGLACLVFDYRFFGQSTGLPRGLIDIDEQIKDWNVAIDYAGQMKEVDPKRIALFGSSFSGGHVIKLTADRGSVIKATISQCPFTDGFASAPTVGYSVIPRVTLFALRDFVFGSKEKPGAYISLLGEPGEAAMMNSPNAERDVRRLLQEGHTELEVERVPARIAVWLLLYRPGRYASKVRSPIFFAICEKDSIAPASTTSAYARTASRAEIKVYKNLGHFDIYVGQAFEEAVKDYIGFYQKHLLH